MDQIVENSGFDKSGGEDRQAVKKEIRIPEGLEIISGNNAGTGGEVHIDRVNKKVYRRLDFTRYPTDVEINKQDFFHKIEVSDRDITGLTPHIFAYNSETYTLEMELIEGTNFTHNVELTQESGDKFIEKLIQFHGCGLYHGDLFTREHWFLTPEGEIRLIDPIDMATEIPNSGNTVESVQTIDRGIAALRLKEFGIDTSKLDAKV